MKNISKKAFYIFLNVELSKAVEITVAFGCGSEPVNNGDFTSRSM